MREPEMREVAHLVSRVIDAPDDEANADRVREDVAGLCGRFPIG
jgi:glycine/serine hydroxymethyltransferase